MDEEYKTIEMQKKYIEYIIDVAQKPDFPNKIENLQFLLEKYKVFCEKYHLETFDTQLNLRFSNLFILESEPLLFEVNIEKVKEAIEHLQEVQKKNQFGLVDGLSDKEAKVLLDWNIQSTRAIFGSKQIDVLHSSMHGLCKLSQNITLNAFREIGLENIANDDTAFPNVYYPSHSYGIVKIPILENNIPTLKEYLVDVSYRQFFEFLKCYPLNNTEKPEAGFYTCQTEEGKKFASELLKNGYIELTKENAKLYGIGFSLSSKYCVEDNPNSMSILEKDFYKAMHLHPKSLVLSRENLVTLGYAIDIPSLEPRL